MDAEIITSKLHIDPKRDDGYLIVKLGYAHSVVGGKRALSLNFGNEKPAPTVTSYKELTDVYDTDFTGKDMYVPAFDEATDKLVGRETIELTAALMALLGIIEDAIVDGVTTKAPSQNAVFDALALKVNLSQATAQTIGATGARLLKLWATAVEANTLDGAAFNLANVALFLSFLRTGYAGTSGNVLMSQGISTTPKWTDILPTLKIGGATDYANFETDGTLKFNGAGTFWQDIDFPIIIRTTGTGIPTLQTLSGNLTLPQWQVNDYNISESQELVHQWLEGSQVTWHIHLTTNGLDAADRYVRFEVEYGYVTPSGVWVFPATIDSGELLIPANTTDKTMFIFNLGTFIPQAGTHIGGHVVARLKRIAATGTAPTNNPFIPMLQLHIECDTVGSRTISAK